MKSTAKIRADCLVLTQGLAESREKAQALILAGQVYAKEYSISKPGQRLPSDLVLYTKTKIPYVGRGGIKLAHALQTFNLGMRDKIVLDIGASTGGFTDCMLQKGALRSYALDVGHGQIDYRLRNDDRVVVLEGINARHPFIIPEKVDLATIDVSFISLTMILPSVRDHLKAHAPIIALVKPQFEAHRNEVGRGGVIRDPHLHATILGRMIAWVVGHDFRLRNLIPSPLHGNSGNREFFLLLEG